MGLGEEALLPGRRLGAHVTVAHEPFGSGIKIVSGDLKSWIAFEHADRLDEKRCQITQVNCSTPPLDTGQDTLNRAEFIVHFCGGDYGCHKRSSVGGPSHRPIIGPMMRIFQHG
ncbi:hypothetical protein DC522_22460 [Microvirga sp. KLBC 81]|nr:hypothetical protein DC522_22460 [Microvirga sp. KLBC 81]